MEISRLANNLDTKKNICGYKVTQWLEIFTLNVLFSTLNCGTWYGRGERRSRLYFLCHSNNLSLVFASSVRRGKLRIWSTEAQCCLQRPHSWVSVNTHRHTQCVGCRRETKHSEDPWQWRNLWKANIWKTFCLHDPFLYVFLTVSGFLCQDVYSGSDFEEKHQRQRSPPPPAEHPESTSTWRRRDSDVWYSDVFRLFLILCNVTLALNVLFNWQISVNQQESDVRSNTQSTSPNSEPVVRGSRSSRRQVSGQHSNKLGEKKKYVYIKLSLLLCCDVVVFSPKRCWLLLLLKKTILCLCPLLWRDTALWTPSLLKPGYGLEHRLLWNGLCVERDHSAERNVHGGSHIMSHNFPRNCIWTENLNYSFKSSPIFVWCSETFRIK